jgi:hypothetical protein
MKCLKESAVHEAQNTSRDEVMYAMAGEWGLLVWHPRGLIPISRNQSPKAETFVQYVITKGLNPKRRGARPLETRLYINVDI